MSPEKVEKTIIFVSEGELWIMKSKYKLQVYSYNIVLSPGTCEKSVIIEYKIHRYDQHHQLLQNIMFAIKIHGNLIELRELQF